MGSPITLSGFNQIDFNVVLNAVMQQESQPLQTLQSQQQTLQGNDSVYATLATKLATLHSAATTLAKLSSVEASAATSSDEQALTVSAGSGAVQGRYDVIVSELARAQVMASSTTSPDVDTTTVATGGSLTIGGVSVSLTGPMTLRGLANAINDTTDVPATASLIETSPGAFRLVLTAKDTGTTNGFTVTNALTGTTLAFTDTNNDGTSGDSAADNAVQATNAAVLINNIPVTSASNTLTSGIPGVTMTLLKKDPANAVTVQVGRDDQRVTGYLNDFITAFNDLEKFGADNLSATGPLGGSGVMRGLRGRLRSMLTGAHGTGTYTRLAEVGIGFTRSGALTLDQDMLSEALQSDPKAVASLFASATDGAFGAIDNVIQEYTRADGFLPSARTRLSDQIERLGTQIADLESRLALRRTALQREYAAADEAITRLNAQSGTLSSLAAHLNSTNL